MRVRDLSVEQMYARAYFKGYSSFWEKVPLACNPHHEFTESYTYWFNGWKAGFEEYKDEQRKKQLNSGTQAQVSGADQAALQGV